MINSRRSFSVSCAIENNFFVLELLTLVSNIQRKFGIGVERDTIQLPGEFVKIARTQNFRKYYVT